MSASGFDVVVCGGGTAGPVVASGLVLAGASVALVEAGPDHGALTDGGWPGDLLDASTIPTSHDWGYVSEDRRVTFDRAKVIGGCSAHNGTTASWGHRSDYDGWGFDGWRADELMPLFEDATRRMRVRSFAEPSGRRSIARSSRRGWRSVSRSRIGSSRWTCVRACARSRRTRQTASDGTRRSRTWTPFDPTSV